VLAACFALNMFGRGLGDTYAVFLLPLEREFGWTRSQLTGVYSVYLLVNGFTAPLVGLAFDRLGPRWVFGAGVACLGAAFFLAGGLVSLWQFYLFIGALVGLAVSLNGMVPGSALLVRWYRARLSTALGIAFSAVGVGTLIFVPLAQYLVSEYGWRFAYRLFGSALLVLAPVVLFAIPWRLFAAGDPQYRPKTSKGEGGWTLRAAMRTRVYWGLAQLFFCTATAMFSVVVQLVAFLVDAGFSPLTAATAYGMLGMLSAASVMGSGFLSDRFGYRQTATVSFAGTASGMALLLFLTAFPLTGLLVLFVVMFGLCMGVRGPLVSSVCAKYFAGANVATIYGTIYATNAIGAAFGSYLGGLLHDLTGGYRAGLALALVSIAAAAAPFWTVPALRTFR
jgi:MFS family permease